ncbi:MAG TPA: PIN domain-containing protein [Gammaproteobacteria bacterium]|nr:PIN domain-containing protein [Gammaproteobacteria bacterium]
MSFVVFDSGALIAVERGNRKVQALLERIGALGMTVLVPAAVVAEVWRDGARQARVARLLAAKATRIVAFDEVRARAVGVLLGTAAAEDVVDASVVLCAREHGSDVAVLTSDSDDLGRLDAKLPLIAI